MNSTTSNATVVEKRSISSDYLAVQDGDVARAKIVGEPVEFGDDARFRDAHSGRNAHATHTLLRIHKTATHHHPISKQKQYKSMGSVGERQTSSIRDQTARKRILGTSSFMFKMRSTLFIAGNSGGIISLFVFVVIHGIMIESIIEFNRNIFKICFSFLC